MKNHKFDTSSYVRIPSIGPDKDEALRIAIDALEAINRSELNGQRPGGGHSDVARLSYSALNQIKDILNKHT